MALKSAENLPVEMVAKFCLYARHIAGMRTSSHVIAAHLADRLSGNPKGKRFYLKMARFQKNKGFSGTPKDIT